LVLGGRRYVDWLPYHYTLERSEVFFRGNTPFQNVSRPKRLILDELGYLRNVIAHRSPHAMDVYERLVIGNLQLRPRDKEPSRFLRLVRQSNPTTTTIQVYLSEMLDIALAMAT